MTFVRRLPKKVGLFVSEFDAFLIGLHYSISQIIKVVIFEVWRSRQKSFKTANLLLSFPISTKWIKIANPILKTREKFQDFVCFWTNCLIKSKKKIYCKKIIIAPRKTKVLKQFQFTWSFLFWKWTEVIDLLNESRNALVAHYLK